jgi:hypothetical protein
MMKIIITTVIAIMALAMISAPLLSVEAQQSIKPPKDFKCPTKVQVKLQNVNNGTWYFVQLAEMYMSKQAGEQESLSFMFNFAKGNPIWGIPTEPGPMMSPPFDPESPPSEEPMPPIEPQPMVLPVSCPAPGSLLVGWANNELFAVEVKETNKPTRVSVTMPTIEQPPTEPEPPVCPPEGNGTIPECPIPLPPVCPPEGNGTDPNCPVEPPNGNTTEPLPGNGTNGNTTEPIPGNGTNGNTTEPIPTEPPTNTTEPLPGNGSTPIPEPGTPNGTEPSDGNFLDNLF